LLQHLLRIFMHRFWNHLSLRVSEGAEVYYVYSSPIFIANKLSCDSYVFIAHVAFFFKSITVCPASNTKCWEILNAVCNLQSG
jgi:hypothetical protein